MTSTELTGSPEFESREIDRLLLVEGKTDVAFFQALLEANNRHQVHILPLGGEGALSSKVRATAQTPRFERLKWLGLVIDGDDAPSGQFQSACDAIRSLATMRFEIPNRSWVRTARTESAGSASIVVLPDGTAPGNIERYLWHRILGYHQAAECVEEMIGCLDARGIDKRDDWKARCNSFLHALRPSNEKARMTPESNGIQLFLHTPPESHDDILAIIPADDEQI